jgi:hypothetical protein
MRRLTVKGLERWSAMGVAGRLWWAGAASLGLAAMLAVGTVTVVAATGGVASGSSSASAPSSMGKSRPSASTASGICPNVVGATVMPNGMVMAPVPSGSPTSMQQAAADKLVAETTASLKQFASLSAATAAGYVPATKPNGFVVHYANWQIVKSGDVLDPSHPSSLVYANTLSGPVLLGAMYLGAGPCQPGPDVGGPLTQWHAHDNLCLSATHQVVGNTNATGTCATGVHNTSTFFMLHVWVAPSLASTHQFQADLTRSEISPIIESGQP